MGVCVDDSFRIDAGILGVRRLGDGAAVPWPFASDPTDTNGLKRDSAGGGLWVAPEKKILRVQHTHSNAIGTTVSNGSVNGVPLTANITNPDAFNSMLLVLAIGYEWNYAQGPANSFTFAELSFTKNDPTPAFQYTGSNGHAGGIYGNLIGWIGSYNLAYTDILAPGASVTYRVTPRMTGLVGVSKYSGTEEYINGFGITL